MATIRPTGYLAHYGFSDIRPASHLSHYGIPGQKRGVRWFQYEDGSLTADGKIRYGVSKKQLATWLRILKSIRIRMKVRCGTRFHMPNLRPLSIKEVHS